MIFILWLVAFTTSEIVLAPVRVLMLILPVIFLLPAIYYLIDKNRISGRGDIDRGEKKIKLLTNKLYFVYSLIMLIALCVMINMLWGLFLR